jgi:toxin ParE2
MKLRITEEAEVEVDEAVAYFNAQRPGLGSEFAAQVRLGLDRLLQFPHAWPPIGRRLRRFLLGRFSYALIYYVDAEEIVIVAVAHLKRRPGYWRKRLKRKTRFQ